MCIYIYIYTYISIYIHNYTHVYDYIMLCIIIVFDGLGGGRVYYCCLLPICS